jgi:integrase
LTRIAKNSCPENSAGTSANSFRAIAESFLQREGPKLRSADRRHETFERLVYPVLGSGQIDAIRRSDIVKLLDSIEDQNGPSMAHVVLTFVSRVFTWHAGRSDEFRSPIVRGMGRINAKERVRTRILSDDELRAVWTTAEASGGSFDRYIQFLLLTPVRRNEAGNMTWAEFDGADWLTPASQMKSKQNHLVPLSRKALATLAKLPTIGKAQWLRLHEQWTFVNRESLEL